MTEAEQIIEGAKQKQVALITVADDGTASTRVQAHNAAMNRLNGLIGNTNWALVATDDEYELLAARLGVLS